MKASILSTIAACLLPAIAAPYEGAHDLTKREYASYGSLAKVSVQTSVLIALFQLSKCVFNATHY